MRGPSIAALALVAAVSLFAARASADGDPPAEPEPAAAPEPPPAPPPSSVLIDASDASGRVVRSVTVLVDDKAVAYALDGRPITLDPGPHTITLQTNEGARLRVSTKVSIVEGETARPIHLAFPKMTDDAVAMPVIDRTSPPVVPRLVVALGLTAMLTGAVVILARPGTPPNCQTLPCTRSVPDETDAQLASDRRAAHENRDFTHAGTITVLSGFGLTAGGLLWYFLELPPHIQGTGIAPWFGTGSAGVAMRHAF